jgi:hypothetical protein
MDAAFRSHDGSDDRQRRAMDCFVAALFAMTMRRGRLPSHHTKNLNPRDFAAIGRSGSRVDVCVRSPGQVRKEAAQVNCDGSLGSYFPSVAEAGMANASMTNARARPS